MSPSPVALPPARLLPLFTYGTLLEEAFTGHLLEHSVRGEPARLLDFELLRIGRMPFATVFEAPGETVEGRIYRDLTAEDYVRLDAYEGVREGLYRRIETGVVAGEEGAKGAPEPAFVYVATERTLRRYGAL